MSDCLFCKIIDGTLSTKKAYEDDDLIAIEDINPQAPTHLLIIPKKHIPTPLDINEADKELIGSVFLVAKKLAEEKKIAKPGFRVVMNCNDEGGQTVYHLHFHLLGGRGMQWPPG